jgi:C1A family cysteine protease
MTTKRKYISNVSRLPVEKMSFRNLGATLHHKELPLTVDLRNKFPPCKQQSTLGSCSSFAIEALFNYDDPTFFGSQLFLYYNERLIENDVNIDAGAQISDGIKSLQIYGLCSEETWPYDISKFAEKPPQIAYDEALKHKAISVQNIHQDINSMKNSLVQEHPFVVGIQIFEEFESEEVAKTGIVSMPTSDSVYLGGHAVVVVGYNTTHWIMRNSWGSGSFSDGGWGDNGYFYLPHAYLLDSSLSSDLWSILKVEE